MAKKIATIILVIIILAAIGALAAFLVIRNTPQGQSVVETVKNYFPFGKAPTSSQDNALGSTPPDTSQNTTAVVPVIPQLRQLSKDPTAGMISVTIKSGTTTSEIVRFLIRATGNVYDAPLNSLNVNRISNTTIPKIYEAVWLNGGSGVYVQYLKDGVGTIETLSASLSKVATSSTDSLKTLTGVYLPEDIKGLVTSQTGKLFYLLDSNAGALGITANISGGGSTQVFNSPLNGWIATWPKDDLITLTTKASSGSTGLMYFLNPKTGNQTRILGDIQGLTTLTNGLGTKVFYSSSPVGQLLSYLYDIKSSSSLFLPIATLPEKCVWSKSGTKIFCAVPNGLPVGDYPDNWYQGVVSFSDNIWQINAVTGSSTKIANLPELGRTEIDAVKPLLSPNEDYLIFINKKDSTPWALRLTPDTIPQS